MSHRKSLKYLVLRTQIVFTETCGSLGLFHGARDILKIYFHQKPRVHQIFYFENKTCYRRLCVLENCSVLFTEYVVTKETSRASFWQTVYSQLRFYFYNLISHLLLACIRRDESKLSFLTCSIQGTLTYSMQPPLDFGTS